MEETQKDEGAIVGRLMRLDDAIRTVKDPEEVWLTHNKKVGYQRGYIRVFASDKSRFVMCVFVVDNDSGVRTFYHIDSIRTAEKKREGILLYKRGSKPYKKKR